MIASLQKYARETKEEMNYARACERVCVAHIQRHNLLFIVSLILIELTCAHWHLCSETALTDFMLCVALTHIRILW